MILVGFSTSNALVSRAIRWFTRSKVSHTFLLFPDSAFGSYMVMEAIGAGFSLRTYESFKKDNTVVDLLAPKVPLDAGLQAAASWLGERYDVSGLLGMALVMLGRWVGRKWRNPLQSSSAMFCSEVNVRILQEAGYPGAKDLDPASMSPADLLEFMQ